jgi:Flp pilus assembly CpaF family ATPase
MIALANDYETNVLRARDALAHAVEGPIAEGLAQSDVTEIIVDPNGSVWFDMLRGSLVRQREVVLPQRLLSIINGIAGLLNKKVTSGLLEGELPLDGSRIQAWLPPVSPAGPSLVIRKHRKIGDEFPTLTLDDYNLSTQARETIDHIVRERLNLLIVGSTASGKTTFAGAFLDAIAKTYPSDRVVTIEDTAELTCSADSLVQLHTTKDIDQRALVRSSMRARPDWLCIGEVRGPEAIDMVMSMTTGHSGFSTVHGGSFESGLTRIRQLCRLGGEDTISPDMIADAIQYVILMRRVPSGPRTVAGIAKILGFRDGRFNFEAAPLTTGKDSHS